MARACLNKLSGSIRQGCTITQNGIKNIYLMYPEDVTLSLDSNTGHVAYVSFAEAAKSYLVEGYKQNIQLTTAARTTDASLRLGYSLMFKIPRGSTLPLRAFSAGRFFVMVEYLSGFAILLGRTCPLECSAIESDSNAAGGMFTITLTAPEGSPGDYQFEMSETAKNTIILKSV
jgi:hypothetical protein